MKKILVLFAATLLMTSCGLYNKYERPDSVNTQGLVRDPFSAADTLAVNTDENFGNLPWREVFTDPQLQALIEKALENNTDLRNAALNVKMMEDMLKVAKLAFLPSVAFAPQGSISKVMMDGASTTKAYTLPIAASWNVDLFGNILSQKRSAQMKLLATKDYQVAVKTNIICGVANLYYTLMMLDKQLEIVTDMSGLVKETWDMMKIQKDLGMMRSTGVQSAEANYYSVLAQQTDIKRQIREMENSMSLLLNEAGHQIPRGSFDNQSLPSKFATGVGLQLLTNRADVHAAEMNLAQCFYDVETARSRFYPNITITGTAAFTNNNGMLNPGKWLLSALGSLTQPIFQHGQIVAGLKVAKAQQEQAYNTWQNTVLKAGNEVSNALVLYNASAEKSELEAKQVKALEQNVEDTKLLYASKGSSYLEVIQAQSSLLSARISKVQDDFSKMQAVVNLYQALGGGNE